ncbi:MAG: dihydrodipicolinate synthase family protein [Planctomycetota bacterium]
MQPDTITSIPPIQNGRKITGMSAILLPMSSATEPDWKGFQEHFARTLDAGLIPAVNMDTGYGNLISDEQRQKALDLAKATAGGSEFVAGAFVGDQPGDTFDWDNYRQGIDQIARVGGTPIIFQSHGLTSQSGDDIVESYRRIGEHAGKFLAFELGQMFAPFGKIYDLDVFEGLLGVETCVAAKHSSLSRSMEWDRLQLRDQIRPDFKVLTGNDLAIDMVMYGSDYLLGLSTFAPEEFAKRDAWWAESDPRFYELNDLLQYLGFFAFRNPVPAYKHNAAQFLFQRGWIASSMTYPGSVERPESDMPILKDILERLDAMLG